MRPQVRFRPSFFYSHYVNGFGVNSTVVLAGCGQRALGTVNCLSYLLSYRICLHRVCRFEQVGGT